MTNLLYAIAPERKKRWTVDEYDRLALLGFLPERYELIDGEIIEKMPPNPPHIWTLMLLSEWLTATFGFRFVRTQVPFLLPSVSHKPEPDAAVTREPGEVYAKRLPSASDLLLVAEVSDSTLDYDLTTKASLYAQGGVPEYWVLDVTGERLHQHLEPTESGYQRITLWTKKERLAPLSRPDAVVRVGDLLPSEGETTE